MQKQRIRKKFWIWSCNFLPFNFEKEIYRIYMKNIVNAVSVLEWNIIFVFKRYYFQVSLVFLLEVCLGDNSHPHHHKHHHQHDHSPIQAPKPHSRSQSISKQHKPSLVRPSRFQSLISRLPSSHLLRGKPALRRSQPTRL